MIFAKRISSSFNFKLFIISKRLFPSFKSSYIMFSMLFNSLFKNSSSLITTYVFSSMFVSSFRSSFSSVSNKYVFVGLSFNKCMASVI